MTDRELLELAAKAIGLLLNRAMWDPSEGFVWVDHFDGIRTESAWNPLDEDGDALRLAVELDIYFMVVREEGRVTARIRGGQRTAWHESIGTDEFAATRRAIVSAAAAIGQSLPATSSASSS